MNKIPVGKTISGAYRFAFGNFLAILGIVWFPVALILLGTYLLVRPMIPVFQQLIAEAIAMAEAGASAPSDLLMDEAMQLVMVMSFAPLLGLVSLVLMAMVLVGVTRQALGLRRGPAFFYFTLDYAVWRLLAAVICVHLIMFGFALAGGLSVALLAGAAALAGNEIAGIVAGAVGAAALFFLLLYVTFRAAFFIVPVTVAEGRNVITRSWELTRRNFWRGVVVLVAMIIPFILIEFVLLAVVAGSLLSSISFPIGEPTPEDVQTIVAQVTAFFWGLLPIAIPLAVLLSVLAYGLFLGASAVAYRALVPEDDASQAAAAG